MKFRQKIFSSYGSLSLGNETVSVLVTCLSATEAIEGFFAGTDRVSFILHCTLFHASPKAFVETTMPALIPFVFVDYAFSIVAATIAFTFAH